MRGLPFALVAALSIAVTMSAGCRSSALQKDQDRFRQTILDSYTNQIMDNLIRASNAMPIIQVDYTNITGTITDAGSAGTTPSTTTTDFTQLTFAAMLKLTQRLTSRMFANTAAWSLNASRQQQLAVTGIPVIDKPDVYRAYLDYLSKPGSLIRDCNPPPPEAAHLVRKVGDAYFYVPNEFKREFFELTLRTTVMRTGPTLSPDYYTTKVVDAVVLPINTAGGVPANIHNLTLTIDKAVPNDSGSLKFSKDDTTSFTLLIDKRAGKSGEPITTLDVNYSDKKIPLTPSQMVAALKGAKSVEVFLLNNRPVVSTTDDILKSIFTQVQLNRLDNLRLVSPR